MNPAGRARLEFLRDQVDLLTFCAPFARFRRAGRQLRTLCLIHGERNPSFYIGPDRRHWYCHGCLRGGDVFTLAMLMLGCDFREAVRQVARFAASRPISLSRRARAQSSPPIGAGGVGGRRPPPSIARREGVSVSPAIGAKGAGGRRYPSRTTQQLLRYAEELVAQEVELPPSMRGQLSLPLQRRSSRPGAGLRA